MFDLGDGENSRRFWIAVALFIVGYNRSGMSPRLVKESIEHADRFLREYSDA